MESNNKQAGMPSEEKYISLSEILSLCEMQEGFYSDDGDTANRFYNSAWEFLKLWAQKTAKNLPPPKSEAEKEIDLIGAYDKAERFAKFMHDTYESVAKQKGWETQESCRVEFKDLPIKNKQTMIAVAGKILNSEELSRLLSAASKGKYSEWISAEKEKPKKNQRIDVYRMGDKIIPGRMPECIWDGKLFCKANEKGEWFGLTFVTHWMPLPEAPESSNPQK